MDRKEFLASIGITAAVVACGAFLEACQVANPVSAAPTNVDFTLDLTDPTNAALKSNGGYLYKGGVIVARTISGTFVAVSQTCTHQGGTVEYVANRNLFYCPLHGSNFSTSGSVVTGPAGQALHQYNTSLTGTSLRVYS